LKNPVNEYYLAIQNLLMKKSLTFIFALISIFAFAQKEANMWYFGNNSAIDFNSGSPVVLTNSAMAQFEGESSISDANGSLLFYTDGMSVWNANHQVMPNGTGLGGNASTTQSALIVQQPGSATLYYVFTADAQLAPNGYNYSIVDMSLNGGLGDVTVKNTLIYTPSSEKLAGVGKPNSTDVWVITHSPNNNNFEAYTLSASGFTNVPVVSSVGPSLSNTDDVIGYLKPSTDGRRLAMALHASNEIWLFDFDPVLGIVSNPILITPPAAVSGYGAYGVEFSPNGNILYGTVVDFPPNVYQWDLSSGNAATINSSMINLNPSMIGGVYMGSLALAPDGKIYFTRSTSGYLGSINDPDVPGPGCNLVDSAVYLLGNTCVYGLPNLNQSLYASGFLFEGTCSGDTTYFNLTNTSGVLGALWNFDDPASGVNNTSFINNPGHLFTSSGTYNVTVIKYYAGHNDTITKPVVILPVPVVNLGPDSSFCTGTPFTMYAGSYTSYLWSDNSTDSTLTVTLPGTYWVTVQQNGCSGTDTIVLTGAPCNVPVVNLMSSDTIFCDKNCIDFTDLSTNNPTSWQWFFPGADSTFSTAQNPAGICYNSFGSFDVTLIACNGAGCDTLFLPDFIVEYQVPPQPVITQSNDTLYSTPAYTYAWYSTANPGVVISSNSYITGINGGSYFVVISDSVGCQSSSTIFVATGVMEVPNNMIHANWNPATGMLLVAMPGIKGGTTVEINVLNTLGQQVYEVSTGERNIQIDLNTLRAGIYFIRVMMPEGIYRNEIMVAD